RGEARLVWRSTPSVVAQHFCSRGEAPAIVAAQHAQCCRQDLNRFPDTTATAYQPSSIRPARRIDAALLAGARLLAYTRAHDVQVLDLEVLEAGLDALTGARPLLLRHVRPLAPEAHALGDPLV